MTGSAAAGPLDVPIVSVLTPSFNQREWLYDTITSVANQTYPQVEHVVADGNSTDGTIQLLESLTDEIQWFSAPDRGQAHALNKAFQRSTGDIIGWLNSDDAYFYRNAVQDVVDAFTSWPNTDVIYGHGAVIDGSGRLAHFRWVPPFNYRLLLIENFLLQPAVFVRRSAVEGFFLDEGLNYVMDRDLWLRLGARSKFRRLNKVLAVDRQHVSRKSSSGGAALTAERERLDAQFGRQTTRTVLFVRRILKTIFRGFGCRWVLSVPNDLAFPVRIGPRYALLIRQVARRRSRMFQTAE